MGREEERKERREALSGAEREARDGKGRGVRKENRERETPKTIPQRNSVMTTFDRSRNNAEMNMAQHYAFSSCPAGCLVLPPLFFSFFFLGAACSHFAGVSATC